MSALSTKLRSIEGETVAFWCPGCDEPHMISHAPGRWTWNGNVDAPTFTPSILVTSGHYAPGFGQNGRTDCWCNFNARHPDAPTTFECSRCHTFVTDGKIQFLGDCTHKLANQSVGLPDWPA